MFATLFLYYKDLIFMILLFAVLILKPREEFFLIIVGINFWLIFMFNLVMWGSVLVGH